MGSLLESSSSPEAACVWNVTVAHDPRNAGLYRGINDFRRALHAPILSFVPGAARALGSPPGSDEVHRVACDGPWPMRSGHIIGTVAGETAEELLRDASTAVVHSLFRGHAAWTMRWATRHSRKYWAVPHGCLDPWGLSQRRLAKRLWMATIGEAFLANAAHVVFATGRERDKARASVRAMRTVVLPWPVTLPSLVDREREREAWRKKMNIAPHERVLASVSRLHSMKRPNALVQSFVAAAAPECHLVVVGGDDDLTRGGLQAGIGREWLKNVHFTGHLEGSDLRHVMHGSDGFISLSYRENFGYSVADAAAHGLPLILTPGHDLAYDMPHGEDGAFDVGWLLPDLSQGAAVAAIREFAGTAHAQLASMGTTARAWADDELSVDRFTTALWRMLA